MFYHSLNSVEHRKIHWVFQKNIWLPVIENIISSGCLSLIVFCWGDSYWMMKYKSLHLRNADNSIGLFYDF